MLRFAYETKQNDGKKITGHAGTSMRNQHLGFRKHCGKTIIQCLQDIRLDALQTAINS